jgi:LPS-assembly protein
LPETDKPYATLPQLNFNGSHRAQGLVYGWQTQYTYFYRDLNLVKLGNTPAERQAAIDNGVDVTGSRFYLAPSVSWPIQSLSGFFIPKLKLVHNQYLLNDWRKDKSNDPQLTVPVTSLDTGLFFERSLTFGNRPYTQTLEPRLYYLYVPFRKQTNLPNFDSALLTFNYDQLFSDNRFSGYDRVGDANQLTTGVTSRFIDNKAGMEKLRVSLGQIFYFNRRKVALASDPQSINRLQKNSSAIASQATWFFDRNWSSSANWLWDPSTHTTEDASVQANYYANQGHIFNIAYRFRRKDPANDLLEAIKQTDVSAMWPIYKGWSAFGRWNFDLDKQQSLSTLIGLQYDSCCWRISIANRRYLSTDATTTGRSATQTFLVQFSFKGLASLDNGFDNALAEDIVGFNPNGSSNGFFNR